MPEITLIFTIWPRLDEDNANIPPKVINNERAEPTVIKTRNVSASFDIKKPNADNPASPIQIKVLKTFNFIIYLLI